MMFASQYGNSKVATNITAVDDTPEWQVHVRTWKRLTQISQAHKMKTRHASLGAMFTAKRLLSEKKQTKTVTMLSIMLAAITEKVK